jgi:hypothetical protein
MEKFDRTAVFQQPRLESSEAGQRICEFPGCTEPVPQVPGRQPRYCGPQHRESARTYRRRARHGGIA